MKTATEWLEEIKSVGDGATLGFAAILPAIRDEMRQECLDATEKLRCESMSPGMANAVHDAIRNAGTAPVLEPGMLVKSKDGKYIGLATDVVDGDAKIETGGHVWFIHAVPLTRAEIMAYADKAPEVVR